MSIQSFPMFHNVCCAGVSCDFEEAEMSCVEKFEAILCFAKLPQHHLVTSRLHVERLVLDMACALTQKTLDDCINISQLVCMFTKTRVDENIALLRTRSRIVPLKGCPRSFCDV